MPFYPRLRQLAWERLAKLHERHVLVRKRATTREAHWNRALPLDTFSSTGFDGFSGHTRSPDFRFSLVFDGEGGWLNPIRQAPRADTLSVLPGKNVSVSYSGPTVTAETPFTSSAFSHSVGHTEEQAATDALFALYGEDRSNLGDHFDGVLRIG